MPISCHPVPACLQGGTLHKGDAGIEQPNRRLGVDLIWRKSEI